MLFRSGIDSVQKALQLDPDNLEGWNTLGTLYDRMRDHQQAQQAYSHALSINSDLDYVHNNLCSSFLEVGDYSKAFPHCEQAVKLNSSFPAAQNNLGIVYGMLGNESKAYEAFFKVGDEASAHNNLGWVMLQKSDLEGASEQFRLAAKLKPNYGLARRNYFLAKSLIFKRDGRARGKHIGDSQSALAYEGAVSITAQAALGPIEYIQLDMKLLPTALEYESLVSLLCGSQDLLKIKEISSDMESRIVMGDDILKRQAILKRN